MYQQPISSPPSRKWVIYSASSNVLQILQISLQHISNSTFRAGIAGIYLMSHRLPAIWAPSQYPKRRLFVRSRKVSKPRDWYLKLSYRFEIWQAHRQHCCKCLHCGILMSINWLLRQMANSIHTFSTNALTFHVDNAYKDGLFTTA